MLYLTPLIFRSGLHDAPASSVWVWTILTSTAMQINWLNCPQTCKLLAFNPEAFPTLAYLFLSSLCFYHHLFCGQASKTPIFWESVSSFLADIKNQDEQMLWVAYCRAGEAVKSFGQMSKQTEITWNSSKTQLLLTINANFATEGVTSGLMVSL